MGRRGYVAALRRSWPWLVLLTILGAGAGAAIYRLAPVEYETTIDFYVSTPRTSGTNSQPSAELEASRVSSYVVLLTSERLAKRVIQSTGLQMTPTDLSKEVIATAHPSTVVITVVVRDSSANRSQLIGEGIVDNFGKLVDELDNGGRASPAVVIQVVSGPTLKTRPVSPDPRLCVSGGAAIGLLIGLLVVAARELTNKSVRSIKATERVLRLPVIGDIPYSRRARRSPLIAREESTSVRSEAYRHLRMNLEKATAKSAKVILATSAAPLEGNSATVVNLALAYEELGERVLLIDANMRSPSAAARLELPGQPGLSNVLNGQVPVVQAVRRWRASQLFLLPSGSIPSNPSKLLGSLRMTELIGLLRGSYDRVIVDSPPVLSVADALLISPLVDAALLVIKHGRTPLTHASAAVDALRFLDAPLVGLVFSMRKVDRFQRRRYGNETLVQTRILAEPITSVAGSAKTPASRDESAQVSSEGTAVITLPAAVNGRAASHTVRGEVEKPTVETVWDAERPAVETVWDAERPTVETVWNDEKWTVEPAWDDERPTVETVWDALESNQIANSSAEREPESEPDRP